MGLFPLIIAASAGAGLGLALVVWGLWKLRSAETPQQRLERLTISLRPLEDAELAVPFNERALKPWLRQQIQGAGRLAPSRNVEKLRQNLMRAGYPHGWGLLDFLGIKLLASAAAVTGTVLLFALLGSGGFSGVLFAVILGAMGFLLPDFWLGGRVRQRQHDLTRTLPDALDMLTICVDAGAGLDSAFQKISEKWQNAIASEFGKVVAEISIGITRREALENMVMRTHVPDVNSFVAVLLQAEQFGLSIANVMHTQSEQMRQKRWQRAEEEARKVPTKLLFPLVFMIFPAMFVVTIGPAVPVLISVFRDMPK